MGLYTGDASQYPEKIYQFEETDLVFAEKDNVPLKQLADRTEWLKRNIGQSSALAGELVISSNATIDNTAAGKHVVASAAANTILTITLRDVTTFPVNTIVSLSGYAGYMGVTYLKSQVTGQGFNTPVGNRAIMYMHNREHMALVAMGTYWRVLYASDSIYGAGEEIKGRKLLNNTVMLNGNQVIVSQVPRLYEHVQSLTFGREVVDESTWLQNASLRGLFGLSPDRTRMYLPDERGMFERMLDGGRGIDIYRAWNFAGGYEADALKQHSHLGQLYSPRGYPKDSGDRTSPNGGYYWIEPGQDQQFARRLVLDEAGTASETIVKNIGKYNLMRY